MVAAELTAEQETLWIVALAVGAVVLLVVIALMVFIVLVLRDIHTGVLGLGRMAGRLREDLGAGDLAATAEAVRDLRDELREQQSEVGGSR